ncbi:helix-turn-helix transcriptional regulator [Cypionkella sp. TWP1-2-1b2]|uniref:helix-turn-helix transcriptional regulator n=1 Tax=Cypionkella sp. TWP1-2-1b2 TaxID=2804675 RepID=UPI003CF1BB00
MRRAERLFRLVNELRTRGISRACDLATTFEVNIRTIYRDIAHLQASGLPIEGEAGVGYLLRPGFDLPNVTFTFEQVEALAVGLSFAESLDDPALASAAREVRAMLQANMPDPTARKLADAPYFSLRRSTGAPSQAVVLRKAIRERRIVQMLYSDGAGQRSNRSVRPLAIWNLTDGWMFSGWCELRRGFRTFRFDRIAGLDLTDRRFEQDLTKDLQAFLAHDRCETQAT